MKKIMSIFRNKPAVAVKNEPRVNLFLEYRFYVRQVELSGFGKPISYKSFLDMCRAGVWHFSGRSQS